MAAPRDKLPGLCAWSRELWTPRPPGLEIMSSKRFRGYQRRLVEEIVRVPCIYWALDMGAGKTAMALKAVQLWKKHGIASKTLIVAPDMIARFTWPAELAKWAFARTLRYSVISGTAEQRARAVETPADVYLISRDNLNWLLKTYRKRLPFDALVYDEASRLKSGRARSQRVKHKDGRVSGGRKTAFARLAEVRKQFNRVVLMSGTPAPLGPQDWWGQMFILDHGKRLGVDRDEFIARYFKVNKYSYKITPRPGAQDEIMGKIADVVRYLAPEDLVDLPDLTVVDSWFDLPPKALAAYRRFAREMWLEEHDITAKTGTVLFGKLLQLANGSVYREDRTPVKIHDGKVQMLKEIVESVAPEPVLVFYSFQFDKDAILKAFPKAKVLGETATQTDWNSGKVPLMLAHPERGGYGLNLQHGGRHMVWFGLPTRLEWYLQANKRLHRAGQEREVVVYRLLARNTMDERAVMLLENKRMAQVDMLNAVRMEVDG